MQADGIVPKVKFGKKASYRENIQDMTGHRYFIL